MTSRWDQVKTLSGEFVNVYTVKSVAVTDTWVVDVVASGTDKPIRENFIIKLDKGNDVFHVKHMGKGADVWHIGHSPTLAFAKRLCATKFKALHS